MSSKYVCLVLALGLSVVIAPGAGGRALAQESSPVQVAQPAQAISFNVPSQALGSALTAFARQSGLQIVVDSASVAGKSSGSVVGTMTAEQALQRLLAGTGVAYRFTSPTSVTVSGPGSSGIMQLDPVQVQGYPVPPQAMIDNIPPPYAGGQVATGGQLGLLGNRPVMDTPFNETSYTAKKAQDQQAKTVRDVLIDDPSVRSIYADGSVGQDELMIRGFRVSPHYTTYGGLYGMLPSISIMAELAERVELLKGPSAMLTGMSPGGVIGGTVNVVAKRAPDDGLTQLTANYASAGQFGGHADIARRFGADKQFGVRFNGVFKAGQTAVENNTDQRGLGVLGLDFRGEHVRLSADLGYQSQYIGGLIPNLSLGPAATVPLPWAPDARTNMGQLWGYRQTADVFGVVRAELDLTERITAYAAFGAHDYRLGLYAPVSITINNFNGAGTALTPLNQRMFIQRLTGETGLRGLVDTGPISHEFAMTATTYEEVFGSGFVFGGTGFATNIYNPTLVSRPSIPVPIVPKTSVTGLSSLAIADTLTAADKRIQLTAGLRLQNVTSQNYNPAGQATTGYDQSALSPAVALVFKPWQNVSIYGNWIQGLQQGAVVPAGFINAGEVFPPYKSTQYEVGVKADWGRFTTTASLFQINQPSILTDVPSNTQFLGGEQVNQGLELNVFGEPVAGVRLLGGAMFLNPVLTKTQGGLTNGWIAPMSPLLSINLAGEWDLPFVPGLTLNGRVIYTGSQYIDTLYPRRSLPQWTRFDLGVRYAFDNPGANGKLLVARFNVENVLDASYWAGGNGTGTMMLGAPRIFRLSLTADF